jgi:surface carbohydrate biosynthesis protein
MFKRIKKAWGIFTYFKSAKLVWNLPRKSSVLIFDSAGKDILIEYLKPWNPEILHIRGEQINIRVLLKSFFRRGIKVYQYVDCFIEQVRPRLVITFNDNNMHFYTISRRHPEVKTLFIQNGRRCYFLDIFEFLDNADSEVLDTFFVDHMLVFGSKIGEHYSKYVKGNLLPIGSIKNNFASRKFFPQSEVIIFVSPWRNGNPNLDLGGTIYSHDEFFVQPDRLVVQFLKNYAKKNNKHLKFVTKNSEQNALFDLEKSYYRKMLGYEPDLQHSLGLGSNYQFLDSSGVVVAIESTLGYESIARGNKTAIFSVRGTLCRVFGWPFGWPDDFPDEGPFWTNKPDFDSFARILDYLFEVSDEQWKKDMEASNFSSIVDYDPGNTRLKQILEKELGPPPTHELKR